MSRKLELAMRIRSDMSQARNDVRALGGDVETLGDKSEKASRDMERISSVIGKIGAALAGGALYSAVISATREQERVTAQLEQRLRSTQGAVGLTRDELLSMASAMQQVTTYGDEAVIPAQALLLTFTKIGGDVFPRALEAVLDMSVAMEQDLKSAAIQVGKALNDPVQGITALSRAGIQFTEDQKELIKELVETGRQADAQRLILSELETQMGGSARAARDTFGGSIQALQNAFGDLLEGDPSSPGLVAARTEIESLTEVLSDPQTKEAFNTLIALVARLTSAAAGATTEFAGLGNWLAINAANVTGNLDPLDRLNQEIKDVDASLKGGLSTKVGYLFTSEEELRAIREQLVAERDLILAARGQLDSSGAASDTPSSAPAEQSQDPVLNADAQKLLDTLKKQAETIGLITEEAKTRYAIDSGELGDLIPEHQELLLTQARQLDQAKANATASDAQRKATEKLASAQLSFVTNLERQASLIGLNTTKTREAEIAEKGLTGALLERAQAAAALLAAEEKRQIVAADAVTVAGLQVQLLRAQGKESDALALEMEQRFGALIKSLNEHSEGVGVDIVNELINVEAARTQLDEFEREIDEVLARQQRGEQSINVQQDAGLLSEVAAREQLLELHRATADELERIRPMLDDMASMPGAIGEAATAVLAEIDNQMIRLQSTTSLLVETLRGGLEDGLANALTGLATGTMNLRSAIQSLAQTVIQAMAQMAANQLANAAMGALFSSFGGGLGGAGAAGSLVKVGKMRAAGGQVLGPGTGTSDSIATWLSNEEFVTRAAVVNQPGMLPLLEDINARGWAALHDHFAVGQATGGLAGVPAPAMPSPVMNAGQLAETGRAEGTQLQNNVDVFVGVPEQFIVNGAWSRQGREKFYGVLQEDKATIRQLLEL
ncbi:MAG TPA: hypothetical protein DEP32_05465 [Pseudomonas sp.]|nr:hypothetical protein [Pseudomonas sp.]MBB51945.1 hypothetical protein [Pseudomonadales bacterium]HCA23599.1 hypothetical protein [Pseudomonas sp.]|tara:strand:- start:18330 stop:21029 length:2700 start_codon:yes stop_codon:yes gene_type:complete